MSPLKNSNNLAARMGRWSASHWKTAVFGWITFVVVAVVAGGAIGTKQIDQRDENVGQAHRADEILKRAGFQADPQTEIVIVQSKTQTIDDPVFRATVADAIATIEPFSVRFTNLRSPLLTANRAQVSVDGRTAMVEFDMRGTEQVADRHIEPITAAVGKIEARHPGFFVGEAGSISSGKALNDAFESQLGKAGERSVPLTLLILLLVFGSLVAAGLPLLLALSAVAATLGLVSLPSHLVPMDPNISAVLLLVGLAVGVDYSLFYLKRDREERSSGKSARAALEAAAATSGRAVLVSGLTVMVAMAGMLFSGDKTYLSFGIATMVVVAVAVLGSLTVLPALIARLGDKVDRGRIPFLHRLRREGGENRFWAAILTPALRHPVATVTVSVGILIALAVPAVRIHTAQTGLNALPKNIATIPALDRIQAAFPGGATPALVAIEAPAASPAVRHAVARLRADALATGQMTGPVEIDIDADRKVTRVAIPLRGNGTDSTSLRALHTLRDLVIPGTIGKVPGATYAVTGGTAASADENTLLKHSAPLVFGFVLTFAFILLLVSFRSLVIAAKAIVLNLLSVGAAYGVLVIVFQWGWGASLLDFSSNGGIAQWLPIFIFVILFGLSMDYHVFILSRIREAYDRGMTTEDAIAHGIKSSAGVVTSAALVMVGVFSIFATLPILDMKELGIGLAAAVLIDATIVRALLLPGTMKLLGEWNWYLPSWLGWLPRQDHGSGGTVGAVLPDAA